MAEKKDMTTGEASAVQQSERGVEAALRPPVDIFEDAEGITVVADMPGVAKERLNLQVDKDTLVIEAEAQIDMPEGMEALYADIRSTRYRRSFRLSGELASEDSNARLEDGVLTVRIPKRAEARPRKIEVQTH